MDSAALSWPAKIASTGPRPAPLSHLYHAIGGNQSHLFRFFAFNSTAYKRVVVAITPTTNASGWCGTATDAHGSGDFHIETPDANLTVALQASRVALIGDIRLFGY